VSVVEAMKVPVEVVRMLIKAVRVPIEILGEPKDAARVYNTLTASTTHQNVLVSIQSIKTT
jgi:hypothetical protein